MEMWYATKTIKFLIYDEKIRSARYRRMRFDVARTPALDCLYDADGATRLHALIETGKAVLPIHPWETPDMCAFRNSTAPSLEVTTAFHTKFRSVLDAEDVLEVEGMTRNNADDQLARTREAISEQDPRLPRFSEKVGEWLGSVAHWLEEVDWGINCIEHQAKFLRKNVLEGGHVGAPCLQLCRYWRRNYPVRWETGFEDEGRLFVSTVTEALAERPKRHWAMARASILVPTAIVRFWRHAAAAPDSRAAQNAAKRFKAASDA